jgi:hypothetical protein
MGNIRGGRIIAIIAAGGFIMRERENERSRTFIERQRERARLDHGRLLFGPRSRGKELLDDPGDYDEWRTHGDFFVDAAKHALVGKGPKNYSRPDESIREDASEALMVSIEIDASEIEVEVQDGIVVLKGSVPDRLMKHHCEWVIEGIAGVKDIKNELRVEREPDSPRRFGRRLR